MTDIQKRVERADEFLATLQAVELDFGPEVSPSRLVRELIKELTEQNKKLVDALKGFVELHQEGAEASVATMPFAAEIRCGCNLCDEAQALLQELNKE